MNKVYLLLRSNQQQGPYSLDELLQFDLKAHDLIWIEGRSAGWYYPQEIEALRPHLSFLKKATLQPIETPVENTTPKAETAAKKIFVSMPSAGAAKEETPLQAAAKPVGNTEQTAPFSKSIVKEADEVKTTYAKTLEEVETDYMNWAYQKKAKKKSFVSKKGVLATGLLVTAAFAAWWLLQPSETISAVTAQIVAAPPSNELLAENNLEAEAAIENAKPVSSKKQQPQKATVAVKQTTAKTPVRQREEMPASINPNQTNEYEPAQVIKEETIPPAEESTETVVTEAPKEKKKLRDKIADLFRKKPQDKEEAKPVEEEDGKRQSTRREAGSNLAQLVRVSFDIPNDWMMGINGAKATLANRSSETLARAVVEVVYYNDDNDILARKTIAFTNVKGKQSQTISVPDHQTATRLEYNVISAVGMGEPVAFR